MSDTFSLENRASPAPSGAKGGLPYATSATAVGWVPHATGTQYLQQVNDNAPSWVSSTGSGYTGTVWMHADPNFAVGSSYERVNYINGGFGMVQIAPQRTWTNTIADAKGTTPPGWTWSNSGNILAADENTTTANALFVSHVTGTSTGFNGTTQTAPYIYKIFYPGNRHTFVSRIKRGTIDANTKYASMVVQSARVNSALASAGFDGTPELVFADGSTQTTVATTGAVLDAGVWVRMDVSDGNVTWSYSIANQATPPSSWTVAKVSSVLFFQDYDAYKVGFTVIHATTSTAASASFLYFDDRACDATYVDAPNPLYATGFDDTGPVLTLIGSYNLGAASAAIADADVRSALTEVTNQRFGDAAAWTFSAVRGSSPSPPASTYQAIGSVAVGGTGQYFALYGKATSSGRIQPASFNGAALRIPFTP